MPVTLDKKDVPKYYSTVEHVPSDVIKQMVIKNIYGFNLQQVATHEIICGFAEDGFQIDLYPSMFSDYLDSTPHIRVFIMDQDVTALYVTPPAPSANKAQEYLLAGTVKVEVYGSSGKVVAHEVYKNSLLNTRFEADEYPHISNLLAARHGKPIYAQLDGDEERTTMTLENGEEKVYENYIDVRYFFMDLAVTLSEFPMDGIMVTQHEHRILEVDESLCICPLFKIGTRRHDFEPEYSNIIWAD